MLSARLAGHVALEAQPNGEIAARFYGHSVILGRFSAAASHRAQILRAGLPLSELASGARGVNKEIVLLVQRLGRLGLLEFRLGRSLRGADRVIIEPQVPDYWPRMPHLNETDTLALSRFSYLRRRGSVLVLGSHARAHCFEFAIPKLQPRWPCWLPRNRSESSVDAAVPSESRCSPCWLIAKSYSNLMLLTTADFGRPRATTAWFSGISTIFCFTPAARKADTPIRWAGSILMRRA